VVLGGLGVSFLGEVNGFTTDSQASIMTHRRACRLCKPVGGCHGAEPETDALLVGLHDATQKQPKQEEHGNGEIKRAINFSMAREMIVGQVLTIGIACLVAATLSHTPNFGFGPYVSFDASAVKAGCLAVLPMYAFDGVLDIIKKDFRPLQDAEKAAQGICIALFGDTFNPGVIVPLTLVLCLMTGIEEELLFRGVMQYELVERFGPIAGIGATSIVFGLLHTFTPVYSIFALVASCYFGWLYLYTQNLAIPIVAHFIYDLRSFLCNHWTTTKKLTQDERDAVMSWALLVGVLEKSVTLGS